MNDSRVSVVDEILRLFKGRGDSAYGREAASQREHALQAAHLAREAGSPPTLVVATLLHDVGHMLHDLPDDAPDHGVDDRHEELAARFGPDVAKPARLHVQAKRFLCADEPGYLDRLSEPSRISMRLQGGPMSPEEAERFRSSPHAAAALVLRRCDDSAKSPGLVVPGVEDYIPWIERALIRS
ncbi:HD domain-containing protein [Paludisphaera soli]|uniref:HD domain-containing protein n=1 Tax=Paludisphaera soli TaxID=2712865 RepID=UPI0013EC59B6|nr:HD domain-containing protein [Paludisphaera soli]